MDAALSAVLIAAIGPSGLLGGYAAFRKLREDKKDAEATAAAIEAPKQVTDVVDESAMALRTVLAELTETRAQVDRCPVPDCPVRSLRWQDPMMPRPLEREEGDA